MNSIIIVVICMILYPYLTYGLDIFIHDMIFIAKVVYYYSAKAYIKILKLFNKK